MAVHRFDSVNSVTPRMEVLASLVHTFISPNWCVGFGTLWGRLRNPQLIQFAEPRSFT
jgi:hypothetical protein